MTPRSPKFTCFSDLFSCTGSLGEAVGCASAIFRLRHDRRMIVQELKKKEMEELDNVLGILGIKAEDAAKENESSVAAAKRKKKKEKKQVGGVDEAENGAATPPAAEPKGSPSAVANGTTDQVWSRARNPAALPLRCHRPACIMVEDFEIECTSAASC